MLEGEMITFPGLPRSRAYIRAANTALKWLGSATTGTEEPTSAGAALTAGVGAVVGLGVGVEVGVAVGLGRETAEVLETGATRAAARAAGDDVALGLVLFVQPMKTMLTRAQRGKLNLRATSIRAR